VFKAISFAIVELTFTACTNLIVSRIFEFCSMKVGRWFIRYYIGLIKPICKKNGK